MPMSSAEIQRRYREKKKRESDSYMKKERERKRKAYVPVKELSKADANIRRERVLIRVKKHYDSKKVSKETINTPRPSTRQSSDCSNSLKVAMSFKKRSKGASRMNKVNELRKTIRKLENDRAKQIREKKKLLKRIERMKKKQTEKKTTDDLQRQEQTMSTPRSRTRYQLKSLHLNPQKEQRVRKQLLFCNVIKDELKESMSKTNKKKARVLSMKIIRKYKFLKTFGNLLGIDERTLRKDRIVKYQVHMKKKILKESVESFLEREDNATTMPGKKDVIGKQMKQKMVLNDYMHNLHAKFRLENPAVKISRSRFCQMRPKHVLLANFCNRATCLCFRHQNMALKLRALNQLVPGISKNPDYFITNNQDDMEENLEKIQTDTVKFTEWKKVDDKGKQRWRQVQTEVDKALFIKQFYESTRDFAQHVERVKIQYAEMRKLRQDLPQGHVLVWMDFAENFTCTALEEVQSAYWTSDQVTLHTSVVYFPSSHSKTHTFLFIYLGFTALQHNIGYIAPVCGVSVCV